MSHTVICTSAVGLGIYIPALLLRQQLRQAGVEVSVEVLEDYYTSQMQRSHIAHAKAHHGSFTLAQMAHRMARDVQNCLDGEHLQKLLQGWIADGCRHFIVWSGFWLPILERYRLLSGYLLKIDHCRIDAEISASFRIFPHLRQQGREIWLWHGESGNLVHEIKVTGDSPLHFTQRQKRLVIHGGGWGIGTYQQRAKELLSLDISLDMVIHGQQETQILRQQDCAYQLQQHWRAWHRDTQGELQFPPMNKLQHGFVTTCPQYCDHHTLYNVIRHAQAIISKPGGCSLIDSLAAATPIILLEPYGYAEASNGAIWQKLGFGITYAAWRASGYDVNILTDLHNNLLNHQQRGNNYSQMYAAELQEDN